MTIELTGLNGFKLRTRQTGSALMLERQVKVGKDGEWWEPFGYFGKAEYLVKALVDLVVEMPHLTIEGPGEIVQQFTALTQAVKATQESVTNLIQK